jgi:FkbM family methyltransferase
MAPLTWLRHRSTEREPDDWQGVLALLYPAGLDEQQRQRVAEAIDGRAVSVQAVRRVLGVLDHQTHRSPVTVRWEMDDLVIVDVGGVRLALDGADASVSDQIVAGSYEPHVAVTLDRVLRHGDVFVDVGANVGFHTVRGSRAVGARGRVVAVEANPENARLIAHTVDLNGLTNVEILPFALSAERGHVTFGTHIGSNGGFLGTDADIRATGWGTLVPTFPLDALGLERVSVMKIDVEGAEGLVIDGAIRTIERDRPTIVMEFSSEMTGRVSGIDPAEHLRRFEDRGYSIAVIDRTTGEPRPDTSVDDLLAGWTDVARIEDLLLSPGPLAR